MGKYNTFVTVTMNTLSQKQDMIFCPICESYVPHLNHRNIFHKKQAMVQMGSPSDLQLSIMMELGVLQWHTNDRNNTTKQVSRKRKHSETCESSRLAKIPALNTTDNENLKDILQHFEKMEDLEYYISKLVREILNYELSHTQILQTALKFSSDTEKSKKPITQDLLIQIDTLVIKILKDIAESELTRYREKENSHKEEFLPNNDHFTKVQENQAASIEEFGSGMEDSDALGDASDFDFDIQSLVNDLEENNLNAGNHKVAGNPKAANDKKSTGDRLANDQKDDNLKEVNTETGFDFDFDTQRLDNDQEENNLNAGIPKAANDKESTGERFSHDQKEDYLNEVNTETDFEFEFDIQSLDNDQEENSLSEGNTKAGIDKESTDQKEDKLDKKDSDVLGDDSDFDFDIQSLENVQEGNTETGIYNENAEGDRILEGQVDSFQFHDEFADSNVPNKHIGLLNQDSETFFTCLRCNLQFQNRSEVQSHIRSKHNICVICGCSARMIHMKRIHKYKCDHCDLRYIRAFQLENHCKADHVDIEKPYSCEICAKKFGLLKSGLHRHIQQCHKKSRKCKECKKSFVTEKGLKKHIEAGHNMQVKKSMSPKFHCKFCGKGFVCRKSLQTHEKAFAADYDKQKCKHCKESFKLNCLKYHYRICKAKIPIDPSQENQNEIPYFNDDETAVPLENSKELEEESPLSGSNELKSIDVICNINDENQQDSSKKINDVSKENLSGQKSPCQASEGKNPELCESTKEMREFNNSTEKDNFEISRNHDDIKEHNFDQYDNFTDTRVPNRFVNHFKDIDYDMLRFSCQICDFSYETRKEVHVHIRTDHFVCVLCGFEKNYKRGKEFEKHFEKAHNIECKYCNMRFVSLCKYAEHCQNHHPLITNPIHCSFCDAGFATLKEHKLHKHSKHTWKIYLEKAKAQKCHGEKPMTESSKFDQHDNSTRIELPNEHIGISNESGKRVFSCKNCQLHFENRKSAHEHVRKMHHICMLCGDTFNSGDHMKTDHKFKCCLCKKQFVLPAQLERHCQKVHPEVAKPIKCYSCSMTYSSLGTLHQHARIIHRKQGRKQCDLCGKEFSRKQYLDAHMVSVHEGKSLYKCSGCEKTFKYKHSRDNHERAHHPALAAKT